MNPAGVANYYTVWASVLFQAITDMDNAEEGPAAKWYVLHDPSDGIGSVDWICSQLDLDSNRLRMQCRSREGRKQILYQAHYNTRLYTTKDDEDAKYNFTRL